MCGIRVHLYVPKRCDFAPILHLFAVICVRMCSMCWEMFGLFGYMLGLFCAVHKLNHDMGCVISVRGARWVRLVFMFVMRTDELRLVCDSLEPIFPANICWLGANSYCHIKSSKDIAYQHV